MSVAVELGFKRYCQKCNLPFYDKLADPVVCPHCSYSASVTKYTQLKSSRIAMNTVDDEDIEEDAIDEDIESIEIDTRVDVDDIGVIEKEDDEDEVLVLPSVDSDDVEDE